MKIVHATVAVLALACGALPSHAASVYLTPASQTVPETTQTVAFDLVMDFAADELTVGGGLDLDVSGIASLRSFVPSSYFNTVADPAFSGFGTANADGDLEIHFGNFNGLSGLNTLGTITFDVAGPGRGAVDLAINSFFGGFFSATDASAMDVELSGATLTVTPVPEPQTVLLMLAGLGLVGGLGRRRRDAA